MLGKGVMRAFLRRSGSWLSARTVLIRPVQPSSWSGQLGLEQMRAGPRERRRRGVAEQSEFAQRAPNPPPGMWQRGPRARRRGQESGLRLGTRLLWRIALGCLLQRPDCATSVRGGRPGPPGAALVLHRTRRWLGKKRCPGPWCWGGGGTVGGGGRRCQPAVGVSGKQSAPERREAEEPRAAESPARAPQPIVRLTLRALLQRSPGLEAWMRPPRPGSLRPL